MKKHVNLLTVNITILTLGFFVYVLYIGASIIIPLILALLLSFIILSITNAFCKKGLHRYLSFIASLGVIFIIVYLIIQLINVNVEEIATEAPRYQEKLNHILGNTLKEMSKYGIETDNLTENIGDTINFGLLATWTASLVAAIFKNAGLVIFFTLFILLESTTFQDKLKVISGGEKSSFFRLSYQIGEDITSYFVIKTLASLSVAFLSLVIMYFFGIDFLLFWAFIIFLLNYIPSIGSIIAVFFPVIFSLIQMESFYITTVFLCLMVGAQVLIGNILEPRMLGDKLNLSPLVILISLIFWGTLWGPIGMLLAVPIMVVINIVLAHIEVTRPIAILLSERGIVKFHGMKDLGKGKFSIKKMQKLLKK